MAAAAAAAISAATGGMELLNIHPSASKPSLVSSFWSLHVQMQNCDTSEHDLKCGSSRASLPDEAAVVRQAPPIEGFRRVRSLSDIHGGVVANLDECQASIFGGSGMASELPSARAPPHEDHAEKQRRISFSVQEWLRHVEPAPSFPHSAALAETGR